MSDAVETARRLHEAYLAGDWQAALGAFSEDTVWQPDPAVMPDPRAYVGREGVSEFLSTWTGAFTDFGWVVESIEPAGDRALVIGVQSGRGKASGAQVELRTAFVHTTKDGKITHTRAYGDPEEARRALGLKS